MGCGGAPSPLRVVVLAFVAVEIAFSACSADNYIIGAGGTISQPSYAQNIVCRWNIEVAAGQRIELGASSGILFNGGSANAISGCTKDHLAIYAGNTTSGLLLGRVCSSANPNALRIVSPGNTVVVEFITDAVADSGQSGFTFPWAATSNPAHYGCYGFYNFTSRPTGFVTEPIIKTNFGLPYRTCSWLFWGSDHVWFRPDQPFCLPTSAPLKVYDGNSNAAPLIGSFSAIGSGFRTLRTTQPYMFLEIIGDSLSSGGVSAGINFTWVGWATKETRMVIAENGGKEEFVPAQHGIFRVPYMGTWDNTNNYIAATRGDKYVIRAPEQSSHNRFNLTVMGWSTQSATCGATSDSLKIYPSCTSNALQYTLCGTVPLYSSYILISELTPAEARFEITAGSSDVGSPWGRMYLEWNSFRVPYPQCWETGPQTNPVGNYVQSPLYGADSSGSTDAMNWSPGQSCLTSFTASAGQTVSMSIGTSGGVNYFSAYPGCLLQGMEFFDGSSTAAPIIARICSQSSGTTVVTSSQRYLTVRLYSTVSSSSPGALQYQATFGSAASQRFCVGEWQSNGASSGFVASSYPIRNYYNNMNCTFTFNMGTNARVYIKVVYYDVVSGGSDATGDRLRAYEGSSVLVPGRNYSSTIPADMVSVGSDYTLQWWTNGATHNKNGFNATWWRVYCPDPIAQTGRSFWRNTTHMSITCDAGYAPTTVTWLTCGNNSVWTPGIPSCTPLGCPRPDLGNGTCGNVSVSLVPLSTSIDCTCNGGYQLMGATTMNCLGTGAFDVVMPFCKVPLCTVPSLTIGNGTCSASSPGLTLPVGGVISCSCNASFFIAGSRAIRCLSDEVYNNSLPVCTLSAIPQCAVPTLTIANGLCVAAPAGATVPVGGLVTCSCNGGYEMNGFPTSRCLASLAWNDTLPTCTLIPKCTLPSLSIQDGSCSATEAGPQVNVGTLVSCGCNGGFAMTGAPTSRCMPSTAWNDSLPTCSLIPTCTLPSLVIGNGTCTATEAGPQVSVGASIMCHCDDAIHALHGSATVVCQSSTAFTDVLPTCDEIAICPAPSGLSPPHGTCTASAALRSLHVGATVNCSCDGGYDSDGGAASITCETNGNWSSDLLTCHEHPHCEAVSIPDGGCPLPTGATTIEVGATISCSCAPGYDVDGATSLTCTGLRQYSDVVPVCVAQPPARQIGLPELKEIAPNVVPLRGGRVTLTGRNWALPLMDIYVGTSSIDLGQATIRGGGPSPLPRALLQMHDTVAEFDTPPAQGYQSVSLTDADGGTAHLGEGLYFSDDCPEFNTYKSKVDGTCKPCPEGGICPGGGRLWAAPGYWNDGELSGFVERCPESLLRCEGGRYATCATGYNGPLCANCNDGWYKRGTECVVCPAGGTNIILYIVNGVLIGLLAIAFVVLKDEPLGVVVTIFKVLQLLVAAGKESGEKLPEWVKEGYEYLSIITFDYDFLKPACGANPTAPTLEHIFWGNAIIMALLVVPTLLILTVLRFAFKKAHNYRRTAFFTNRIYRSVTIYVTLLYFMVTTRVFQAVQCVQVGDRYVLRADTNVSCDNNAVFVVGWAGIILFVVLVPVSFLAFMLRLKRDNLLEAPTELARFGYMYDGLRVVGNRFLYGIFPFFHLLFMAVSWTLLSGTVTSYYLAIASFVFMILLTLLWRPFIEVYNSSLMMVSYGIGLISTVSNLLTLSQSTTSSFTLIIIVSSAAVVVIGGAVFIFVLDHKRSPRAANKVLPMDDLETASVSSDQRSFNTDVTGSVANVSAVVVLTKPSTSEANDDEFFVARRTTSRNISGGFDARDNSPTGSSPFPSPAPASPSGLAPPGGSALRGESGKGSRSTSPVPPSPMSLMDSRRSSSGFDSETRTGRDGSPLLGRNAARDPPLNINQTFSTSRDMPPSRSASVRDTRAPTRDPLAMPRDASSPALNATAPPREIAKIAPLARRSTSAVKYASSSLDDP